MVYIENWDDFAAESERLLLSAPSKTRYTFKYKACEGAFVLKVTDDKKVRCPSYTCKYKCIEASSNRNM